MRRLKNIRPLGRYKNVATGQQYNVHKGQDRDKGTDHYFYIYRGKRTYITDADFNSINHEKIQP